MEYYYKMLGLTPASSLEDIKRAYRSLAKQWHPDLNPNDPNAVARFQELGRAYELLLAEKNRPATPYPHYPYPPPWGFYPPPTGYQNYPPPQKANTSPPPSQDGFQSYAWEEWDDTTPPPAPPPPKAKETQFVPLELEVDIEPPPPDIRKDLVDVAFEEACRTARLRAKGEPLTPEAELQQTIRQYLSRRAMERERKSVPSPDIKVTAEKRGLAFRLKTSGKFWR